MLNLTKLFCLSLVLLLSACNKKSAVPSYLTDYADLYRVNPRAANLQWFKDADWGLFLHYGLYAQLEQGEWVQLRHDPPIPVAEYAKLAKTFTAENFDAPFIVSVAKQAGMDYITITSKHHDGFALFDSKVSDFDAPASAAGRDLIGELYQACEAGGIGLFLYYSYAADWQYPYFYSRESGWGSARPNYAEPQPEYLFKTDQDFSKYRAYADAQVKELLTQYPNIAGIWFDPIMGYYARPDLFD
ncbi:MAG: alpha-L-fucosidase, partial [Verrucomicrobiae bacterium]|nr:alpha-L-fucosidase [Verrucomicrobiae bacterium]